MGSKDSPSPSMLPGPEGRETVFGATPFFPPARSCSLSTNGRSAAKRTSGLRRIGDWKPIIEHLHLLNDSRELEGPFDDHRIVRKRLDDLPVPPAQYRVAVLGPGRRAYHLSLHLDLARIGVRRAEL